MADAPPSSVRVVVAPPGPLGLTLAKRARGVVVASLKETSPMHGRARVDDALVAIDGDDVRGASLERGRRCCATARARAGG